MSSSSEANELARLKRSSYWREQDGRFAVDAWRASGEPLSTFARQHGLSAKRIRWWRDRLAERAVSAPISPATLVPVTIVGAPSPPARAEASMEIVLASGHVVRVGADFDAEALAKLVRTLETSC